MDVIALRQALTSFFGSDLYRDFVLQLNRTGRLLPAHADLWELFVTEHSEFAGVGKDEVAVALRVCELHGDELLSGTVPVFHGHIFWNGSYLETKEKEFPNAWDELVEIDREQCEANHIDVWYCPTCRIAAAKMRTKKQ